MAAAFVLQYLLQVPAHTLAYAAALGADLPDADLPDPASLAFTVGNNHVPDRIRLGVLAHGRLQGRHEARNPAAELMVEAERAYRAVAEPLAAAYPAIAKLGSATRQGMVGDLWHQAVARGRAVPRASCCFLYALPGCVECAGCPRLT